MAENNQVPEKCEVSFTHKWTIPNISVIYKSNYFIFLKKKHYSTTAEKHQTSWIFFFKCDPRLSSVYLILLSAGKQPFSAKYRICLLENGKEVYSKDSCSTFSVVNSEERDFQNLKGIPNFITPEKLYKLCCTTSSSDMVRRPAVCEVTLSCTITMEISKPQKGKYVNIPKCTLLSDIKSLQSNVNLSDIVLHVEGHEFPAHKVMLSLRSPVFRTMFQSKMKEKSDNKVVIEDIDPEAFKMFLTYIYTGNVEMNVSLAPKLLYAAEKYSVPRLKAACELTLAESLTTENVIDTLLTADAYNASQLKESAIRFINTYPQEVSKTCMWSEMLNTRHDLTKECSDALIAKIKSKQ